MSSAFARFASYGVTAFLVGFAEPA